MLIVYPDADPQIKSLITDELVSRLNAVAEFRVYEGRPKDDAEFLSRVKEADGVLLGWYLPNQIMSACTNLKVIAYAGIGVKNFVDVGFARQCGIAVTNTPGYADDAVSEHTLALMLAVAKQIARHHQNLQRGVWDPSIPSLGLRGKTIGLIGLGGIGQRVAELSKAFGMNVICWTLHPSLERAKRAGVTFVSLEELLGSSDYISLHIAYTEQTRSLIGEKELSLAKQGAILINTARSELVDTPSLARALASGRLAGAGIDVFDEEPVSKDNPLLSLPNVVLSPHVGFNTPDAVNKILELCVDNLVQFFTGSPQNVVDV
ncbi:2-hydroxyacid dehydrogenase [Brevibacillus sp. B_LB10_24]|uniref:2-hydroxyacid dehydrogenase n=1 Tax=Brevibacillus sp. B_LB10_24 TaxID=3380645 RepID=UPI0038BA8E2D